jgi:ubiquitin C-terminal hydrolase
VVASKRRFTPMVQCDPAEFFAWFLATLHTELGGSKKRFSSIVHRCFQGMVSIKSFTKKINSDGTESMDDENTRMPLRELP